MCEQFDYVYNNGPYKLSQTPYCTCECVVATNALVFVGSAQGHFYHKKENTQYG